MASESTFWDRAVGVVRSYYSEWDPQPPAYDRNGWASIELPANDQAEYRYVLHAYADGERQFSAKRLEARDREHFWYCPYELAAVRNDQAKLDDAFMADLRTLLQHDTRIRQRNGLMNASFRCQALRNGEWANVLCGHFSWRWTNFVIPPAPLYHAIYYRGPLGRPSIK